MADDNLQRKLDIEREAREEAEREMADFREQLAEKEDPATGIPKPILIEVQGTAFEPSAIIREVGDKPEASANPADTQDDGGVAEIGTYSVIRDGVLLQRDFKVNGDEY